MTHEFWTSQAAEGYPNSIIDEEGQYISLEDGSTAREHFGALMRRDGLIRDTGTILDIGAASCSGLIFGMEAAATRVTAVDISPMLLAANPVPAERKLVWDVRRDAFPTQWRGTFDDAYAILMHRYISERAALHLAQEVRRVLKPDGRFIILDIHTLKNPTFAQIMQQRRHFFADRDAGIVEKAGFRNAQTDTLIQYWAGGDPSSTIVTDVVVGIM